MVNPNFRIATIKQLASRFSGNSDHNLRFQSAVNPLIESATALVNMHNIPNAMITKDANFAKLQVGASRLEKQRSGVWDRLNETLRDGIIENQKQIEKKVNLNADEKYAPEIRQVFLSKNDTEKQLMLRDLATSNSGPELAAILHAPKSLTGVGDDTRQRFEQLILNTHAPEELKQRDEIFSNFETAATISDTVKNLVGEMSDPVKLASVERGEQQALAAEAAFNAAV